MISLILVWTRCWKKRPSCQWFVRPWPYRNIGIQSEYGRRCSATLMSLIVWHSHMYVATVIFPILCKSNLILCIILVSTTRVHMCGNWRDGTCRHETPVSCRHVPPHQFPDSDWSFLMTHSRRTKFYDENFALLVQASWAPTHRCIQPLGCA